MKFNLLRSLYGCMSCVFGVWFTYVVHSAPEREGVSENPSALVPNSYNPGAQHEDA